MIITIHQPSFFPWWPFFMKMKEADVFVILRHCQFEKNGFQNRFQYNDQWLTMSTKKGLDPILEKTYINPHKDWEIVKRKLGGHEFLNEFDKDISHSLWETNYNIIKRISKILDIETKIMLDEPTGLKSTDRLVQICKSLKAKKYISGSGGKKYLEIEKFESQGIEVIFQNLKEEDKIHTFNKLKNFYNK